MELRITSVETASIMLLLEASEVEADRHKTTGNRKFGGKRLRLKSLDDADDESVQPGFLGDLLLQGESRTCDESQPRRAVPFFPRRM